MHEAGLMQQALDIAFDYMRADAATSITRIKLSVGSLSGVVPDALQFAFEALTPGTPAEGASLELEMLPLVGYCAPCASEQTLDVMRLACPQCGGTEIKIIRGREFLLTSLEVT